MNSKEADKIAKQLESIKQQLYKISCSMYFTNAQMLTFKRTNKNIMDLEEIFISYSLNLEDLENNK